jgi:hypothetical protein
MDRAVSPKLLEERRRREIAHVQDGLRRLENAEAAFGKAARAAREVRIPDERDQRKSGRKAPSR